jgi:hypothetical protein
MLLTYTGRRTGRAYTIPVGYFVWDADALMAFSSARWWTNLRDEKPVRLLLQVSVQLVIDLAHLF